MDANSLSRGKLLVQLALKDNHDKFENQTSTKAFLRIQGEKLEQFRQNKTISSLHCDESDNFDSDSNSEGTEDLELDDTDKDPDWNPCIEDLNNNSTDDDRNESTDSETRLNSTYFNENVNTSDKDNAFTDNRNETTNNRNESADNRNESADNRIETTDNRSKTKDNRNESADNRNETTDNMNASMNSETRSDREDNDEEENVIANDPQIIDHEEVVQDEKIRKRRQKAEPEEWIRNKNKKLRMEGKSYKGIAKRHTDALC